MSSRAAIRYAKAILEKANESNTLDAVFTDMRSVQNTISENKDLQIALHNPVIKAQDKKEILLKIFQEKNPLVLALINILVSNKRTALLENVTAQFIALYESEKGIVNATVTTAVPLTSDMEMKVMTKVKEMTHQELVNLTNRVDPKILGGFILRVGDIQYDASISNQFRKLKREFTN